MQGFQETPRHLSLHYIKAGSITNFVRHINARVLLAHVSYVAIMHSRCNVIL